MFKRYKMVYKIIKWCIEQHSKTNHLYDGYIPYEFHLRMVASVGEQFKHLLDNNVDYYTGKREYSGGSETTVTLQEACLIAVWGHDLIEDARCTYNDVKRVLGGAATDIVYAVTNEKGKNRKERANDEYYEGIRNTNGAVFVKLCDRIANVKYGKLMGSNQFETYKKENEDFMKQLGWGKDTDPINGITFATTYAVMFNYLINLFQN